MLHATLHTERLLYLSRVDCTVDMPGIRSGCVSSVAVSSFLSSHCQLVIKIFVYSRDFFKVCASNSGTQVQAAENFKLATQDKWHAYDSFAITGPSPLGAPKQLPSSTQPAEPRSLIGALVNALVAEKAPKSGEHAPA